MGRARAAIVVVVAIAAVSAIVLLSPSPRPLTAPLCDKQPGNGEERSAAIGQAVERALRDAPGDPTQTIVDLGPCFRATDLQANGAAFLRVTRADDAGHEFDLIAYRGDGAWHVRSLLKADVDTHIEIVVSAGAAVDVLFSMSNASSFGPGIDNGWFELHRLTDDLRLIWRSSDYGVADVRVLRNDLMLTTRASEQTLWRRRGDAFEAVLQRTVPSVGRVSGDFLSALRRGPRHSGEPLSPDGRRGGREGERLHRGCRSTPRSARHARRGDLHRRGDGPRGSRGRRGCGRDRAHGALRCGDRCGRGPLHRRQGQPPCTAGRGGWQHLDGRPCVFGVRSP